jgi:hypothetical protein
MLRSDGGQGKASSTTMDKPAQKIKYGPEIETFRRGTE